MLDLVRAPNEPAMRDHCSEVRPETGRHNKPPVPSAASAPAPPAMPGHVLTRARATTRAAPRTASWPTPRPSRTPRRVEGLETVVGALSHRWPRARRAAATTAGLAGRPEPRVVARVGPLRGRRPGRWPALPASGLLTWLSSWPAPPPTEPERLGGLADDAGPGGEVHGGVGRPFGGPEGLAGDLLEMADGRRLGDGDQFQ